MIRKTKQNLWKNKDNQRSDKRTKSKDLKVEDPIFYGGKL